MWNSQLKESQINNFNPFIPFKTNIDCFLFIFVRGTVYNYEPSVMSKPWLCLKQNGKLPDPAHGRLLWQFKPPPVALPLLFQQGCNQRGGSWAYPVKWPAPFESPKSNEYMESCQSEPPLVPSFCKVWLRPCFSYVCLCHSSIMWMTACLTNSIVITWESWDGLHKRH